MLMLAAALPLPFHALVPRTDVTFAGTLQLRPRRSHGTGNRL